MIETQAVCLPLARDPLPCLFLSGEEAEIKRKRPPEMVSVEEGEPLSYGQKNS